MDAWRTAIINADSTSIRVHGYDVTELMRHAGFVETVFLLHRGRLPGPGERRLLDAMDEGDHGSARVECKQEAYGFVRLSVIVSVNPSKVQGLI